MTALPRKTGFFRNLKIGTKLTIGLGILAFLTLLVVVLSYEGSATATKEINTTDDVRVPTALVSSRAQADLLRMLGDIQAYLALGDTQYQTSYDQSSAAFQQDVADLKTLSADFDPADQQRLVTLEDALTTWLKLPSALFDLRNDQLAREPAYKILVTDGTLYGGTVLIDVGKLIDAEGRRTPTAENIQLLAQMGKFQGSFAAMLSGLRGYVTTRNRNYRGEYEANLALNDFAWDNLATVRSALTPSQQAIFDDMATNRDEFLTLPPQMFAIMESPSWRLDLFEFSTVAVPLADTMLSELSQITTAQQDLLRQDLDAGRTGLAAARLQTLGGGGFAVLLSIALALILGNNIAGPVRRLTGVAEQIRAGDLEARAPVESADELGVLAAAFNSMTAKLRQTLMDVRREKKRADDLLEVVIPIGVELVSEKDFNHLLEEMLLEAKSFCHADAGTLYLHGEDNHLEFVIVRNDTLKVALGGTTGEPIPHIPVLLRDPITGEPNQGSLAARAALSGASINVADDAGGIQSDLYSGGPHPGIGGEYRVTSALAIPLKSSAGEVLGILQLCNATDTETGAFIPFDPNLQQMMESFSSLAVAALEAYVREQKLQQQIQRLQIEIDEAKQRRQVSEIVETDFFHDLQEKARGMRIRRQQHGLPSGEGTE